MSKPRYRWWGYIRNVIRAYPELKKEYDALHQQSVTANLSGMPSPISGEEVVVSLNGRVDAIIDSGAVALGKESTVLSLVGTPKILRSGALDKETIGKYIDLE